MQHIESFNSSNPFVMRNNKVACVLEFLSFRDMVFEQTNQFNPNPTERGNYQIREWYLSGETADVARKATFVLVARVW